MEDLDLDVKNPSNPVTAKYLSVLSGFSYLASKYEKCSSVEVKDIDSVLTGFSKDFEDRLNKSGRCSHNWRRNSSFDSAFHASHKPRLPAIQNYFSEGGTFSTGSSLF